MKTVCVECGSDKVQTMEWVDINTGEPQGEVGAGSTEESNNWCPDCDEHTKVIDVNK